MKKSKDIKEWEHLFPFPEIRSEQEKAINFIIDTFLSKRSKIVIAQLGTGVGKSAIALTISRWVQHNIQQLKMLGVITDESKEGSYILTSQKILQDQYAKEFKGSIVDIRSSSNFKCKSIADSTCGQILRLKSSTHGDEMSNELAKKAPCVCSGPFSCNYRAKKETFKTFPHGVTNYSYLLSEVTYVGDLTKRNILICDEAHNIENEIRKWATCTINENFAATALGLEMPWENENELTTWIKNIYYPELSKFMANLSEEIKQHVECKIDLNAIKKLTKQYDILDKHVCNVTRFLQDVSKTNKFCFSWELSDKGTKTVSIKPLDITSAANDILYSRGQLVLLMSATVLERETFIRSSGLAQKKVEYISIPSPFPVINRPMYSIPVGSLSKGNIDSTLPKIAEMVKQLLHQHKHDKGIIHCHTFKIAKYLKDNIKDPRLMIHDSNDRDVVLNKHIKSKKPTVLLSPSMAEGVDLKNDLSRFQIICKIPYPYLGDPLVQMKMKHDQDWYTWLTVKTLIQSVGRSIRSQTDYATTYILDDGWDWFFKKNRKFFPSDFYVKKIQS